MMLKANKPRDGCDGCDGKSDTAKATVAIVATVAEKGRQHDLPRPPSPSKKSAEFEMDVGKASAEAAYPLGEPTILCSRRMKVS